jgi:hypothetical protein
MRTHGPARDAPPREGHFAQLQEAPHLHNWPHLQDGPQLQALIWLAHLHVGVQVQGLHVHFFVMSELLWFD